MSIFINKRKLKCPRCSAATRPAIALDGGYSEFIVRCTKCNTFINTFVPLPHQKAYLEDSSRYSMTAGGVGTGKTKGDVMDSMKHEIITPRGQSLLGAPTMPQLRATLKKDVEMNLPIDWVENISRMENKVTLKNGHEILFRPFDDPEKLKSLNLSYFVILEASRTKYSVFTELQRRLRNTAGVIFDKDDNGNYILDQDEEGNTVPVVKHDWRKGRLETNPDAGWVKTQILERSGKVYLHHKSLHNEQYYFKNVNPKMSTHIAPTKANYYLPKDFIKDQSYGMPEWYVRRNFYGSFQYAEGMVYPKILGAIVKPFTIPKRWKRVIAMDYGINDNTHILFGAIDNEKHICYIYKEIVINDADVRTIALQYKREVIKIPWGNFIGTPVMDQRSLSKRQAHDVQKTLGDLFLDEGLVFEPAQMNMNARILRTNTLINLGQLKIFSSCTGLIDEAREYKFPEKSVDKPHIDTNKPMDKFNHGVNALEFLCMELPHNLEQIDFKMYNGKGVAVSDPRTQLDDAPKPYNPLETKRRETYGMDSTYYNDDDSLFDPFSDL